MTSGLGPVLALVVLCLILMGWVGGVQVLQWRAERRRGPPCGRRRTLQPRPADDCPACRAPHQTSLPAAGRHASVPPWRSGTSRRGRPRQVVTAGHACPEPTCPYYGITDTRVHALIGYGCTVYGVRHLPDFPALALRERTSHALQRP
jgi:hypothetical protein